MSIVTSDLEFIVGHPDDDIDFTRAGFSESINDPGTTIWFIEAVQPQVYGRHRSEEGLDTPTTQGDRNSDDEAELYESDTDSVVRKLDEMVYLAAFAQPKNRHAFVTILRAIDWTVRSAADSVKALQMALSVGAFMDARYLALQAAKHHPQHSELQKYAHLLDQPKVTRNDLPSDPTLKTNQAWLNANRTAYRGQWVALRDGRLLGSADSLQTLVKQVGGHSKEILLTKVF